MRAHETRADEESSVSADHFPFPIHAFSREREIDPRGEMSVQVRRAVGAVAWAITAFAFFLWRAPGYDFFAFTMEVDHTYQVTLGQQMFLGGVAGIDYYTQYGPAIGWVSAINWSTGHVWLSSVISWCLFLATSYGLLWWWVARDGGFWRKACVLLPAFFFYPFYAKYYFVFFPALFLVLLGDGEGYTRGPTRRWRWISAGVVAGVAGLFRLELGLALGVAGSVFLGWNDVRGGRAPRALGGFLVGAGSVVGSSCLGLIILARSFTGLVDFWDFQRAAIVGKVIALSNRGVGFGWPTNQVNAGGWLLVLTALLYLAFSVAGMLPNWRAKLPPRVWAAALVGAALLPQALHRIDVIHLRQVILPACAAVAALILARWDSAPSHARLISALSAVISLHFGFWTSHNYLGWTESVPRKLASLYAESGAGALPSSVTGLTRAIRETVSPDATILVPSLDVGFYSMTRRRWAGLVPHLVIPLPVYWQEREIEALRRRPPALIALRLGELPVEYSFRGKNPLVEAFIAANFEPVERTVPGWLLLRPRAVPGATTH